MSDAREQSAPQSVLFTVGHSTRSADEFTALLRAHGVRAVADVRLIPASRRYPHYRADEMATWLPLADIDYVPFKDLGGRRRPSKDSINTGWKNESFRGYADYMQTSAFLNALDRLMSLARATPTTIMCAEAVPWRCHRSLIADALLVRGWRVLDIMSEIRATPHKVTRFAKVEGVCVTYPPEEPELFS